MEAGLIHEDVEILDDQSSMMFGFEQQPKRSQTLQCHPKG
jgi:hypothetical protein